MAGRAVTPGRPTQRAARAAARRRVGAYTAVVAVVGLALLLLAAPAAVRTAERSPFPVLVLVLLVLAAELMPLELDRPPEGSGEPPKGCPGGSGGVRGRRGCPG